MQVVLELKTGVLGGEKIYLAAGQSVTVGRSETARFPIPTDGQMSGLHFEVTCNENDCLLMDLNSTNGTRLNGEIVGDTVLHDGDQITAGQSIFAVSIRSNDDIFDSAIDEVPAAASTFSPTQPEPDPEPEPAELDSVASVPGTIHLTSDDGFDIRIIPGNAVTVGRTERADYAITHDGHMSGVHFAVLNDGGQPRVRDEKSTNGTRLNGTPVSEDELKSGDVITAGRTEFRVAIKVDELPTPKASPSPSATVGEIPTAKILVAADTEPVPTGTSEQESVARSESTVDESSFVGELDDLYPDSESAPAVSDERSEVESGKSEGIVETSEVRDTPSEKPADEILTNEFPTQPIPDDIDEFVTSTPKESAPPEYETDEIDIAMPDVESPDSDDDSSRPPNDPAPIDEAACDPVVQQTPHEAEPAAVVASEAKEEPSDIEPVCPTELKIVIVEYSTNAGESHQFWLTPNQLTIVGSGEEAHERIEADPRIKSRHFALSTDEKACRITDLESSGTLLNDNKIDSEYVLNDDTIVAGSTTFKIQVVGGIEQVERFS